MAHVRTAALLLAGLVVAQPPVAAAAAAAAAEIRAPGLQAALDYARAQKTTGFLVIRDGQVLARANWPLPEDAARFRATFAHGVNAAGEPLEDVASLQKSVVAMLTAIAVDKGLLDVEKPVSAYLGPGWSKASPDQEARIRVIHVLTMSSGLDEGFAFVAEPGTVFLYNTPVYAVTQRVLEAAARRPLAEITRDWLTGPAGMADTAWRPRPAAFGDVGNPVGLVTTPGDLAKLGQLVLDRGRAADGTRVVSETSLADLFRPSPSNPAYGRLWWLNGSDHAIRAPARRADGPLIPTAPPDLAAALGALDRKLYISPGRRLVVVRLGQAAPDKAFDANLWRLLSAALD
ncbi:serine hydrolase domain-containing protein [Phenylobacterium sp.]|uniref:serine hydrolase domain-containing protein n=1 Tax=Phenylobacterium sp. TaxID=1871053 RepID=UPI00391D84B7